MIFTKKTSKVRVDKTLPLQVSQYPAECETAIQKSFLVPV